MSANQYFEVTIKNINGNINIHVLEIDSISLELKTLIDENLVSIYKGTRDMDLKLAKQKLLNFLDSKHWNTKMGAIAEFFIHLYLSTNDFKQECLMDNLEEGSIKKGFDGYYSKEEDEWIMESKSGSITTGGISHKAKVTEAYSGLKSLLSGGSPNNPWENAYNHASHRDVSTRDSIIKNIQTLSDEFDSGVFYEIKNFNIVPSATIFYDGTMTVDTDKIIEKVESLVDTFEFKRIEVICISKKSLNLFIDYLNEAS